MSIHRSRANDAAYESGESDDDETILPMASSKSQQVNADSTEMQPPPAKRVNNVWAEVLMEDQLSEKLTSSTRSVTNNKRTLVQRSVESYDSEWAQTENHNHNATTSCNDDHIKEPTLTDTEKNDALNEALDGWKASKAKESQEQSDDLFGDVADLDAIEQWAATDSRKRKGPDNHGFASQPQRGNNRGRGYRGRGGCHNRGRGRGAYHVNNTPAVQIDAIDLDCTLTHDQFVDKLAAALKEQNLPLLTNVVREIGTEQTSHLFDRTCEIEATGGMMVINGSRRRTPGGVFLHILRTEAGLAQEKLDAIFAESKQMHRQDRKMKKAKYKKPKDYNDQLANLSRLMQDNKQNKADNNNGENSSKSDFKEAHAPTTEMDDDSNGADKIDAME